MRRSPRISLSLAVTSLLIIISLPAFAAGRKTSLSAEDKMSAAGQLATRAREALKSAGIQTFARAQSGGAKVDADQCINARKCGKGIRDVPIRGGQAETSIAVDSTGQHIVVGFNDTRGFDLNPISLSGFLYSDDGGQTFVDGGQLPTPGDQEIDGTLLPWVFGDPDVKYLGACKFVYSSILITKFSETTLAQTISVHRSSDCGHTWTGPFEVTSATNPNGLVIEDEPIDAADKPFMDVDPETGRVIISWSNFTPFALGGVEIATTYSDDAFTGNPPTWSVRQVVAAEEQDGQGSIPRSVWNGSNNAYIVWRRFPSFFGNTVGFARSEDGGATWSAPVDLAAQFFTMDQVLGNDRVNTNPSLAVDNSAGAHSGNIYVVYSNNNNQDGADIYFQRSTDGGDTFSDPVPINNKPGHDRAQWFPWVAVDSTTGRVNVFYYDQGAAKSGDLTQVSYTFSDDGGAHFQHPRLLSDSRFKAGWGNDTGQPNLGDYNQGVAQNGQFYAVWAQTELRGFTDGQPDLGMDTPDVFFKSVPSPAAINATVSAGIHQNLGLPVLPSNNTVSTFLVRETFDHKGLPPGALPAGWVSRHGAGANEVPWVTDRTFCGSHDNAAFHQNADDGLPPDGDVDTSPTRWERLISPAFAVPEDSDLVAVDFDICYDTEDDPNFNILAYDGAFLRITDLTPGHTLRSVLAEAFEQRFTTGGKQHYPKHFPRSNDPAYFEDMSAWAGDSGGHFRHVHMEFQGMAGTIAQLRFEYTQDFIGTCADVRPGHTCGVAIDNVRVRSLKIVEE